MNHDTDAAVQGRQVTAEDMFAEIVADTVKRRALMIESVLEDALQGGLYGVLVLNDTDGTTRAAVCPAVPYGNIYEHHGVVPGTIPKMDTQP